MCWLQVLMLFALNSTCNFVLCELRSFSTFKNSSFSNNLTSETLSEIENINATITNHPKLNNINQLLNKTAVNKIKTEVSKNEYLELFFDYFLNKELEIEESVLSLNTENKNARDNITQIENVRNIYDIAVRSNPLDVLYGRVTIINSDEHLSINVRKQDNCLVKVINDELLLPRAGYLHPSEFDCQFGQNEVWYSHLGGRNPQMDTVKLMIKYQTNHSSFFTPATLQVRVVYNKQLEVVVKNVPLKVETNLGISNIIDLRNTVFLYDKEIFECFIITVSEDQPLPRYGTFSSSDPALNAKSPLFCDEFLGGNFSYKHEVSSSLRTDFIPVKIELYSRVNGSLVNQEFFHKTVLIPSGKANRIPFVASNSTLYLNVYHPFLTPLTQRVLLVLDEQTSTERILLVLKSNLESNVGKLVSTDYSLLPVTSFYQRDLSDLKIAFIPSENEDNNTALKLIKISLEAVDEEGASSQMFELTIALHPWSKLLPHSMKFNDLTLLEGESKIISLAGNYESSLNYLANYHIVDGMKHGHVELNGTKSQSFTWLDLEAGSVTYSHDGSETTSDNIMLELFTNSNIFELMLPVSIFPVDDTPPKMTRTSELEAKVGKEVQINDLHLKAEDRDSEYSVIKYKVSSSSPKYGYFVLKDSVSPGYTSSLNYANNVNSDEEVLEWTQEDIKEGRLYYIVSDYQRKINDSESVTFTVSDNSDPPNYSEKQNLTIRITSDASSFSGIFRIANKPLSTFEYQIISVSKEFLSYGVRYNDSDSDVDLDLALMYTFAVNELTGSFLSSKNLDQPINRFSQRQVNENAIIYRPPNTEIGHNTMQISICFTLTHENSSFSLSNQSFSVLIKPVNNMAPELRMEQAKLVNGSYDILLTRNIMKIHDRDTDEAELLFRLVTLPRYGNILYKKQSLFPGSEFTIKDIENGNIRYESNLREAPNSDFFVMEIDDRIHRVQYTIDITSETDVMNTIDIISDNEVMNSLLEDKITPILTVNENSIVRITSGILSNESNPTINVTYIIEKAPLHGMILRDDKPILKFQWIDIQNQAVVYTHDGSEIGMTSVTDRFALMVLSSSQENTMKTESRQMKIDVMILPTDNSPPDVIIVKPLTVSESFNTSFGIDIIEVVDSDTDISKVICFLTTKPDYGVLVKKGTENVGIPLTTFTHKDLSARNITYFQNIHNKTEPKRDSFTFYCSDAVQDSHEITLEIIIYALNDEKPQTSCRQIVVDEGATVQLNLSHINTVDLDEPEDIIIYQVLTFPKYGTLSTEENKNLSSFERKDLLLGKILYNHDGSETTADRFELIVSDGKSDHELLISLQISVKPVDDQPPKIKKNRGISLNINDSKVISSDVLFSTDSDTSSNDIIYVIKSLPRFGVLEKLPRAPDQNAIKLSLDQNFTQLDLADSVIQYRNTIYTTAKDAFSFELADCKNNHHDSRVIFSIEMNDTIPPTVINDSVEIYRGGWVYLTNEVLKVSDQNTPDKFLNFTVTTKPTKGNIKHADNPTREVISFSQMDLGANKILYVHNSKFNESSDSFEYSITDGFNVVQSCFRIHIDDVNAEKPILHLSPVEVEKGLSAIISNSNLKIEDSREPPKDLTFIITNFPKFGSILLEQKKKVTKFSQEQVNDKKISYHHDGSRADMDEFHIVITDGFHEDFFLYPNLILSTNEPQEVHVKITPREQLTLKDSLKQGLQAQYIPRNKFKGIKAKIIFQITTKNLNTAGLAHPGSVIYIIEEPPKSGYICNIKDVMKPLSSFTQDDVNSGVIRFVYNEDTKATYDIVKFRLMDEEKGLTTTGKVQFEWSFIKLEKDFYAVNQSDEVDIFLLRRGSLEPAESVNMTVYNANDQPIFTNIAQFNPGQSKVKWTFKAEKNKYFAELETVRVKISDGVMAATEEPDEATIFIRDQAEESIVEFTQDVIRVTEKSKKIKLTVKRIGDAYKGHEVLCFTVEGTANGTKRGKSDTFSDYVSRPKDKSSLVRFKPRQTDAFCEIQIIDDTLLESEESFTASLASINGGSIGSRSNVTIKIEEDIADYPQIFFAKSEHYVTEEASQIEIWIFRSGNDLRHPSTVEVKARLSNGKNYLAGTKRTNNVRVTSHVEFPPDSKSQPVTVSILNDSGRSLVEGIDSFNLLLRNPKNAKVADRSETSVIIKDRMINVPSFEFASNEFRAVENSNLAKVLITRKGDLAHSGSVRCYTRGGSAADEEDFIGRPDSDYSKVTFEKGDTERYCDVRIVDDLQYEKDEYFGVFLSSPEVERGKAIVGPKNFARVIIDDAEDEPVIFFETAQIQTAEPNLDGDVTEIKIKIYRKNYLSSWVLMRVFSKDGSATSPEDYIGLNKELYFYPDSSEVELIIPILGDSKAESRESFTVNLEYLKSSTNQEIKVTTEKVVIFVEDPITPRDKEFPSAPIIVSMAAASLDNQSSVPPGFPVLCLTACDEQHPLFIQTRQLCKEQNINNSLTKFRWQISSDGVLNSKERGNDGNDPPRWKEIPQVFLARHNSRLLDKLFMISKTFVRCYATAVSYEGHHGKEAKSSPVFVEFEGSNCPRRNGTLQDAQPYVAKVKYKDNRDFEHPNTVSIEVLLPHQDGMIPIISTKRITSLSLTLSVDSYRVATHKCSNMIDIKEGKVQYGFVQSDQKNGESPPQDSQFYGNSEIPRLERFYKYLNEDSCIWRWTGVFTISELISLCGAEVDTDYQKSTTTRNQLQLLIPLFVSYAFYAPDVESNWRHVHQRSELRLNLVYDTSILLSEEFKSTKLESSEGLGRPGGTLIVDGLQTERDGRISLDFMTESTFPGRFGLNHSVLPFKGEVTLLGHPDLTFTLQEMPSSIDKHPNIQSWRFVSDFAVQDYSGLYLISLIPCVVSEEIDSNEAKSSEVCHPEETVTFEMEVNLQQVMSLVAEQFSLKSRLRITRNKTHWFDFKEKEDRIKHAIFYPGDRIYGSVFMDPVDNLAGGFQISIEKCFVCTGFHSYVPKFDPTNGELGCFEDTEDIRTYKIIDKRDSPEVDKHLRNSDFNARLLADETSLNISQFPSLAKLDGFSFDVQPLFQISKGDRWFVHIVFVVERKEKSHKHFVKRQTLFHEASSSRIKMQKDNSNQGRRYTSLEEIGTKGLGTNMCDFYLKSLPRGMETYAVIDWNFLPQFLVAFLGVIVVVAGAAVASIVIYNRRKRKDPRNSGYYSTVAMTDRTMTMEKPHTNDEHKLPKVLSFYSSYDEVTEV